MSFKNRFFFRKKEELPQELQSDNPFLNARRAWNSHVAGLMSTVQLWQLVGIIGMLIGLAGVAGMTYIGSQSKFIPLVFQQDSGGNHISMTKADAMPDAQVDDFRTAATGFIQNIRLVTADTSLMRRAVEQAYAFLNADDPSMPKANQYLNGSKEVNPFSRAESELVNIDIRSVLQQTKDSWQVDWVETLYARDGSLKENPYLMRAILNLYQISPGSSTTDIELLRNPHFIFVRDFHWTRQHLSNQ